MYKQYTITASTNLRLKLAKWLLSLYISPTNKSVPQALKIADDLISGGQIEVIINDSEKALGEDVCTFTEVRKEDPYVEHFRIQSEYAKLCELGAAGDAEAAIAYCKLEMQGLVSHGAYG